MDGVSFVPASGKRPDSPTEVKLAIAMYTLQLQSCIEHANETSLPLGSHMSSKLTVSLQMKVHHEFTMYSMLAAPKCVFHNHGRSCFLDSWMMICPASHNVRAVSLPAIPAYWCACGCVCEGGH